MDILKLKSLIKETPNNYEDEYNRELELYRTMVNLPKKPVKELCQLLDFLCTCSKYYDSDFAKVLVDHNDRETNPKIKEELFKSIMNQKKADKIPDVKFFQIILERTKKTPLKWLQNEILKESLTDKFELLNLFEKALNEGTDFQKPLACFLIIFLFENTEDEELESKIKEVLKESLFKHIRISKMVILYFLNAVSFEVENDEKKSSAVQKKKKSEKRKRIEDRINEENIKKTNFLSSVITKDSEKSKIVQLLTEDEAKVISKKLFEHVESHIEDREFRILRLKVIGLLKVEFDLKIKIYNFLFKMIDFKNDDLKILMSTVIDSLEQNEAIKCVKKVLDLFCPEYKDDDYIAFGLNLIKEICLKFEGIREEVRGMVSIYKDKKDRAVFYSYNNVMRAIRYGITDRKEVDYIRRKRVKKTKKN